MLDPNCGNCPYWHKQIYIDSAGVEVKDKGECRRFPPHIIDTKVLTPLGPCATFNITPSTLVCGEHPLYRKHFQLAHKRRAAILKDNTNVFADPRGDHEPPEGNEGDAEDCD